MWLAGAPLQAGAGWTACLLLAPQHGMGQHAGSGAGVRARKRERKNTETALVEVRGGHRTCSPHPTLLHYTPNYPSETKNKNVEKSLYRSPVGNGGRDAGSSWSPLPTN